MVYVKNVDSLPLVEIGIISTGVNHVTLNIYNKISKIGPVEVMTLIISFKRRNSMLRIRMNFWSGLNMIGLKMSNIWPRVDLERFIKHFGKMDLYIIGILIVINGKDIKIIKKISQPR